MFNKIDTIRHTHSTSSGKAGLSRAGLGTLALNKAHYISTRYDMDAAAPRGSRISGYQRRLEAPTKSCD